MSVEWRDDISVENHKLYKENRNSRRAWEQDAVRFDDFRYGQHFSRAEEKELLAFRQAPLPISITTAICDTAEALMTTSRPTIRTAPIINPFDEKATEASKAVAQRYDYLIKKSWYDSLGGLQYDRVVRDYTNVGHGFFYVTPRDEFGEFNVDIKHISWRYVYPHAMTKDPFYRDMDNVVVAMRISEKAGYKFVKGLNPDMTLKNYEENFVKGNRNVAGETVYTRYSPNSIKGHGLMFIQRMMLEEKVGYVIVPLKGEKFVGEQTVRFYPELTESLEQQAKEGLISIRTEKQFFLTEYTSVGGMGFKKVFPIKNYNLIPMVYDHRDTPYPYGRIWYLYPLQRALNKFIMIALLNGSLINATRVLAEEKSIVDDYEWSKNFSVPGGKLIYRLPIPGVSTPPTIIQGQALSDAWLQFPQFLVNNMEYISGIFGTMMGDSKNSPEVFSTVAALQSAGGQKIKRRLAQADAALSIVGQVVGEFYKEYAPLNGFATVINETGEQEKPVVFNIIQPDPEEPDKLRIDPTTDLSRGFKTVRFTSGSSNGYEAGTEAALLTNLATQLKVPALVPLILKRLNMADVDKITDQISVVNQQDAQLQQMQKTIQELESRSKVLANKVTEKGFELSKSQFDKQFAKILAEFKNNPELVNQLTNQETGDNGR